MIEKLSQQLAKFPGIGPRQAKRFVYFLLKKDDVFLKELSQNILNLKQNIKTCESCYRFFQPKNLNAGHLNKCDVCLDVNRDNSVLMIVGTDADMENIEKNHIYNGHYFVLGGYFPILNNNAGWVRTEELKKIIDKRKKELKEIILALSLNPEGENSTYHIKQILKDFNIKTTTLGKGLSTGTELEYSDDDTLKNALKNRN